MKKITLIVSLFIFLTGCSNVSVDANEIEGSYNAIYEMYNYDINVENDNLSPYGKELINKKYDDNDVHIFADGSDYLIIYQNEENIDFNGKDSTTFEYNFVTDKSSEYNGFYQMYAFNAKYPEDYNDFRQNDFMFKLDDTEINVNYKDVSQKLFTDSYTDF